MRMHNNTPSPTPCLTLEFPPSAPLHLSPQTFRVEEGNKCLLNSKHLPRTPVTSPLIQLPRIRHQTHTPRRNTILRTQNQTTRLRRNIISKQLAVSSRTTTISSSSTTEKNHCISDSSSSVEVQASLGEGRDDERGVWGIIMRSGSNQVEFLACSSSARLNSDGD